MSVDPPPEASRRFVQHARENLEGLQDRMHLLYVAGAATYILHPEHPDRHSGADAVPDQALATKCWIFDQAATEGLLVIATRFAPFSGLAIVVKK